jgi:hypothetical protein
MTRLRSGAALAACAALFAAGMLISAIAVQASTTASAVTIYTDKVGDASPDITSVSIAHTADQNVTLTATIVGLGAPVTEGLRGVWVYVEPDDDTSPATPPYNLALNVSSTGSGCIALKYDGVIFRMPDPQLNAGCSIDGDTLTWTFNKAEIGAKEMFSFFIVAWQNNSSGAVSGQDRAPDFGRWGYSFAPQAATSTTTPTAPKPARPVIGAPAATPRIPVAGKRFAVTFAVSRSDTGALLTSGTMTCDPSVAGVVVKHTESFTNGKARLAFVVPKTAKGKLLKIKVKIANGSQAATKVVTYTVI